MSWSWSFPKYILRILHTILTRKYVLHLYSSYTVHVIVIFQLALLQNCIENYNIEANHKISDALKAKGKLNKWGIYGEKRWFGSMMTAGERSSVLREIV